MVVFPVHQYPKEKVIFEEGTIANVAYILKSGLVEISIRGKEGKIRLAVLQPGAIFGEMALLLKDNKRTATATVLEDCEVVAIYKNFFMDYLKDSPVVISTLISGLIERLHETTSRLAETEHFYFKIEDIVNLLISHGVDSLKYDELVQTIRHCSGQEIFSIEQKLEQLVELGHIHVTRDEEGKRIICLPYRKMG